MLRKKGRLACPYLWGAERKMVPPPLLEVAVLPGEGREVCEAVIIS